MFSVPLRLLYHRADISRTQTIELTRRERLTEEVWVAVGCLLFDRLNLSLECSYAIENCTKSKWFSIELCRVVHILLFHQDPVRTVKTRVWWVYLPGRKWLFALAGWVVGSPWAAICKTTLQFYQCWRQFWRKQDYNRSDKFLIWSKVRKRFLNCIISKQLIND